MANRHQQPHNGEVPPYVRLHYLRQTLGASSIEAGQVLKTQQNPIDSPEPSPRDDHQPHHFGEDYSHEGNITDADQSTEEKVDHWETNEMADGGHSQMLDSIPNDSDLENAILSLLLELEERIGTLESSRERQEEWNHDIDLAMDRARQIQDIGEIPRTKKTVGTKRSAK